MIGALLFQRLEGWPLSDSAYFCFITLSTIGFGDFVPGKALGYKTPIAQVGLPTMRLILKMLSSQHFYLKGDVIRFFFISRRC